MPISGRMYYWGEKAKCVPEEPGVYAFYSADEKLIFLGKSANLREAFGEHLKIGSSDDSCKRETKYYKREFTSEQEGRFKELLEEYKQQYGELPKCNVSAAKKKEKTSEDGFHFYKEMGEPLSEVAFDLQDLQEKISQVPIASLEFHQERGDFANWIKDVLKENRLAEAFQDVSETGEELRSGLLNLLKNPEKVACPNCGNLTISSKTWKMAGRPSKAGERMQLTIAYYKCSQCDKGFKRVLDKKKIKA